MILQMLERKSSEAVEFQILMDIYKEKNDPVIQGSEGKENEQLYDSKGRGEDSFIRLKPKNIEAEISQQDLPKTTRGCLSLNNTPIDEDANKKSSRIPSLTVNTKYSSETLQTHQVSVQTSPEVHSLLKTPKLYEQLTHSYRMNFPIKQTQAQFLMMQLLVRLTVKGETFGNLVDFHGELFQSQIVSILKHKLMYESMKRMRKTVRYMFQITPFDNERRRNRLELIDAVQDWLGEQNFFLDKRATSFRKVVLEEIQLTSEERQNALDLMQQSLLDYECCTFDQAVTFLSRIFSKDDVEEFLCIQLEQKKNLISINICQGLGLNPLTRLRDKSAVSTTETGNGEEVFTFEDCEIQSIPYEIIFADALN